MEEEKARAFLIQKISRRERPSAELRKALLAKGCEESLANRLIQDFVRMGYVNDQRYAEAYIRYQAMRGKGPRYIQMKLKEVSLSISDDEIAAVILERTGEDHLTRARAIVERRYARYREDPKTAKKAYEALIRRGFSFDIARKAVFDKAPDFER